MVNEPDSQKTPTCCVPDAELIWNTRFCRLVAWAVGQWIPVAEEVVGMLVMSKMKLRTWR